MKFEELKLPTERELRETFKAHNTLTCVAGWVANLVFDQMREYYEGGKEPAPGWRLPDPPPGQKWHRTDWTQDRLPEGYRPLLLGEPWVVGDEVLRSQPNDWGIAGDRAYDALNSETTAKNSHCRTRRPLPAPVEYVPLGPGDIPPGSHFRCENSSSWFTITACEADRIWHQYGFTFLADLAEKYEILRPGSNTWVPCKKPKD